MNGIFEKIMWFAAGLTTLLAMLVGYFALISLVPSNVARLVSVVYVPAWIVGIFFIVRTGGYYAIYIAGIVCSIVPMMFLLSKIFQIPAQD